MNHKHKLGRILGITGWSRDRLADMLDVSNGALGRWLRGRRIKHQHNADDIDYLYTEIVEPLLCQIEPRATSAEKHLLKARIARMKDNRHCL
jgi:transcriptional regulator with XRE-family HTH domain